MCSASEVVVHLSFGERSAEPEIREESARDQDPLAEGISATLESIRRQIEEGAGKVAPPQRARSQRSRITRPWSVGTPPSVAFSRPARRKKLNC